MGSLCVGLAALQAGPAEALQYYRCTHYGRSVIQTTPCHHAGTSSDAPARDRKASKPADKAPKPAGRPAQGRAGAAAGKARAAAERAASPPESPARRWPWSGLKRGMGLAAVSRQIRDAEQKAGGYLINGAQALLVKQDIEFAGARYRADYYFLDYGYQQVSLRKPDGQPRDNEAVRAEFARLAQALTKVLGRPSRQQPIVQNHFSLSGGMEWDLPGNDKAWLSIVPVSRSTSHLTFGYRPDSEWKLPRP